MVLYPGRFSDSRISLITAPSQSLVRISGHVQRRSSPNTAAGPSLILTGFPVALISEHPDNKFFIKQSAGFVKCLPGIVPASSFRRTPESRNVIPANAGIQKRHSGECRNPDKIDPYCPRPASSSRTPIPVYFAGLPLFITQESGGNCRAAEAVSTRRVSSGIVMAFSA